MTTSPKLPTHEISQGRSKSSLTGTLVRTLLIFAFIPLVLMAGAAYFRARALLREQAIAQAEALLSSQIHLMDQQVKAREDLLKKQVEENNIASQIESAFNVNPQDTEFQTVRNQLITSFSRESTNNFDTFLLVDTDGVIRVSSDKTWQGEKVDPVLFNTDTSASFLTYQLTPLYNNQLVLVTVAAYHSQSGSVLGSLIGITETENLKSILQPLNGLAPYANTYLLIDNQIIAIDPVSGDFVSAEFESTSQNQLQAEIDAKAVKSDTSASTVDVKLRDGTSALTQLQWLPSIQSGVALTIDSDTIYSHINNLAPFTIILAILTLFAVGLVIFFGTQRVVKPLQQLATATQNFANGDWEQRTQISSNDEIGQLAGSFNSMADQIKEMHQSLEKKVDERALQIRTAAEVAQSITTISNLDEMLNKTVELLVQQFGFYQASIFMVDRTGRNVDFKTGYGSATQGLLEKKYSLPVGSASIVGWVAANNQARVASDVLEDPLHLKNELLTETRSEACVPISLGSLVLGILDVQSTQPGAFGGDALIMLQTLASQIAAAIQTAKLVESSHIDFQELERLYRSSQMIAEAGDEAEILRVSGQILKTAPYPAALFQIRDGKLILLAASEMTLNSIIQNTIEINTQEIISFLSRGSVIVSTNSKDIPKVLKDIIQSLDLTNVAFLPIKGETMLDAIMMIGSRRQNLADASIQPYENLTGLMSVALQRVAAVAQTERHLHEVESLASINELVSSISDIQGFFHDLLQKIQQIIGDYNMLVAIYDATNNSIHIPFSYEDGKIQAIPPFPLGEGLTSILIRTRQPLMMIRDTERKAAELGAKITGKPAKSWMGAPMIVQGNPIGALIIQDADHEGAFDENDLKFFTTVASQVAGVIHNAQLLEESKQKAIQVEAAAEIARDISGSLNLDELLLKAVGLIRERFDFYHAAVFLLDQPGEFAVIREATGEAGAQMKRQGHKIGVGSKSIVGFVSGKGEALVVNDTSKDLTYYANPLLPDTHAEAAIPLRIGDRILGALDIQSTRPFAFSEDNLRSLQILADQLAIAVENTELFAETQEHLSQHRLLHHITSTAASGTTLEEALESAVSGLQVTLGGDRVMILLTDREKQILEVKASVGYAENAGEMKVEIGKGVTGWVAAHRRPLRVRDTNEDPRYIQISANTRSELAVPLIYRNELLGVINVESEQLDAYTENDEEMLGTLGGSLAAIIANARLLEQIRAQSERERLVYEISGKIRRSTDIQSILLTTASEISRVTGARYTKIKVNPQTRTDDGETES